MPEHLSETGRQVFQSLPLGLVVFDARLRIMQHNQAASFLVEQTESMIDALSQSTLESRYEDWEQVFREVLTHGREHRFEQVLYSPSEKQERLLNLLCSPLRDEETGAVTGGLLVIEDVTAAVSMEKRLAVSERLAAVGKLAAKVAHELNNPLDGILRYLNLALRAEQVGKTEKINDYLSSARKGLLRMAEIVRELGEFSRSTATTFDDTGINAVVEEAVKVMSDKAVANGVSVVCTLSEDMPAIRGANLFQVFCNLIKNAIDAMPDGGTLTVKTAVNDRDVSIRFQDTGMGIDDDIDRLFEPFYTTKEAGKGTGLGLAISKDIVEKYNGRISVEKREQGGTTFSISIPLESCATAAATSALASPPSQGRGRFTSPRREISE
jgi:signal transduction histidine kinase